MTTMKNRRADEFEKALATRTSTDAAVAGLVAVATALTALPKGPAPAFREGLRAHLMAEAGRLAAAGVPAAAVPAAAPAASPLQALAKVLAKPAMQVATGGLAATIAATGVGVGTSRALPGDALYDLKKSILGTGSGGTQATLDELPDRVDEIVALLDRDGAAAVARVEALLTDLKGRLDQATADLLAQVRAGSRTAYDTLLREVADATARLQALRERLPEAARDELDAAMATVNTAAALLRALPVPGVVPPVPTGGPGTVPPTSIAPTSPPRTTPPSSIPVDPPTTNPPSTKPVTPPTITVPPVTDPPVPTVEPTLPVPLPTNLVP